MGGGSGHSIPGWEPRGVFCNHNMISCAEKRSRQGEGQRPGSGSAGDGVPSALAPLGLLWNSLCARHCHALSCEWHLALGGGLLGSGRGLGYQEAILWGQLGTAGPGRKRAVPRREGI